MKNGQFIFLYTLLFVVFTACNESDNGAAEDIKCVSLSDYLFKEDSAYVKVEYENGDFPLESDWKLEKGAGTSGRGFMVWRGEQSLGKPGNGMVTFKLSISTTGIYRFIWKSAVTTGDNGTEHNDTWLRFADADNFYGEKNESRVYPKGSGKTPNPKGASADGWFKVYRSGNDLDFKWQARTSDNDAHNIYVQFNSPGTYTMEASARSSGNGIDQFLLFQEDKYSEKEATAAEALSEVGCAN